MNFIQDTPSLVASLRAISLFLGSELGGKIAFSDSKLVFEAEDVRLEISGTTTDGAEIVVRDDQSEAIEQDLGEKAKNLADSMSQSILGNLGAFMSPQISGNAIDALMSGNADKLDALVGAMVDNIKSERSEKDAQRDKMIKTLREQKTESGEALVKNDAILFQAEFFDTSNDETLQIAVADNLLDIFSKSSLYPYDHIFAPLVNMNPECITAKALCMDGVEDPDFICCMDFKSPSPHFHDAYMLRMRISDEMEAEVDILMTESLTTHEIPLLSLKHFRDLDEKVTTTRKRLLLHNVARIKNGFDDSVALADGRVWTPAAINTPFSNSVNWF